LLFEKQILLSHAFITYFTNSIHQQLPDTRQFDADTLWNLATRVEKGFIRVEADEVTYPLHVLLRYEIEKSLINGDVEPQDVPDMWNQRMQKYLGLSTEGNFTDGCMQDIHYCTFVIDWLRENIWSKGSQLESQELMQSATGEKTNPDHFMQHIRARYVEQEY